MDNGFYRGLLKLQCICAADRCQGYTVLQALLHQGYMYVGFRYGQAVFILVTFITEDGATTSPDPVPKRPRR